MSSEDSHYADILIRAVLCGDKIGVLRENDDPAFLKYYNTEGNPKIPDHPIPRGTISKKIDPMPNLAKIILRELITVTGLSPNLHEYLFDCFTLIANGKTPNEAFANHELSQANTIRDALITYEVREQLQMPHRKFKGKNCTYSEACEIVGENNGLSSKRISQIFNKWNPILTD